MCEQDVTRVKIRHGVTPQQRHLLTTQHQFVFAYGIGGGGTERRSECQYFENEARLTPERRREEEKISVVRRAQGQLIMSSKLEHLPDYLTHETVSIYKGF